MIVVDTHIIVGLWLPCAHTELAEHTARKDSEWVTPHLWRSEFRNVLAGLLRQKQISLELAFRLVEETEAFLAPHECAVPAKKVMQLAATSGCSAYDCEFVALAMELDVSLVSTNPGVLKKFPAIAVSLETFVAG